LIADTYYIALKPPSGGFFSAENEMKARTTNDLMNIARVGGGLKIDAGPRTAEDLMNVARVASQNGATIVITGTKKFRADDLMNIARVGKGCVTFED
jgi:hypothetical protein